MNEQEIKTNAALAELEMQRNIMSIRAINLAIELAVTNAKMQELLNAERKPE